MLKFSSIKDFFMTLGSKQFTIWIITDSNFIAEMYTIVILNKYFL
jgi:hypothetical protein